MTKKIFLTLWAADLGLTTHLSFVHLKELMAFAAWLKASKPWWYQVKKSWKLKAAQFTHTHTSTDCTELRFPNGDAFLVEKN